MKKPMKLLLIAMLVSGSIIADIASAMPGQDGCGRAGRHRGMGPGGAGMDVEKRLERMAGALDLTREQREQMRSIMEKIRPAMQPLRERLRDNRKQLQTLAQQDKAAEGAVRRLADMQGKALADMIVLRSRMHSEMRALLTPAQRRKMQERHKSHQDLSLPATGWGQRSDAAQPEETASGERQNLKRRVSM